MVSNPSPQPGTEPALFDAALKEIQQGRHTHDRKALVRQKNRVWLSWFTVVLSTVSIGLLSAQEVFFREGGRAATGLIFAELLALSFVLFIWFSNFGKCHVEWIHERLRAEILRREEFLLLAGVGPYLRERDLLEVAKMRVRKIGSDMRDPRELLSMKDGATIWRDALEDNSDQLDEFSDLESRIVEFRKARVTFQKNWLRKKSINHERSAKLFTILAKLTLMTAFIVAGIHLGLLFAGPNYKAWSNKHRFWLYVLPFLAIWLPAIGGAFASLLSLRGSERLARSYGEHAKLLEDHESALDRLCFQLRASADGKKRSIQLQFMRTVLAVEDTLSNDLRQWWLVAYPRNPNAVG